MPATNLWAVDSTGRVHTLSTAGSRWQELPYSGVDLKRVSALPSCAWGIGSDHQVYMYLPQSDVPIRVAEVTYENQRWNPKDGFCARLLPTDRPSWSSRDGLVARYRENIHPPSLGWQWEGRWYLEDNMDGQLLGTEGWTYSVDFPFTYTHEKHWNSMVRRRKWIRYRRYVATDRWAEIEGIHSDPVLEPVVDVSIGGVEVPGGDPDHIAVWVVTVIGRVFFRENVTRVCPEGTSWIPVPVPENSEVSQVSVGRTGLTWAVAWNGNALVRLGVSRYSYIGTEWTEVAAPDAEEKLLQVAVGQNMVWAVGRNGTVWFRKGIRCDDLSCRASVTGSGWVKMIGTMAMISVGPNDQVWGITRDDRQLCLRTGVTLEEASGREWKEIVVPFGNALSRTASVSSLTSLGSLRMTTPSYAAVVAESGDDPPRTPDRKKMSRHSSRSGSPCSDTVVARHQESVGSSPMHNFAHSTFGELSTCMNSTYPDEWPTPAVHDAVGSVTWSWVSGTACTIDFPGALPNWFSLTGSTVDGAVRYLENAEWRKLVLRRLRDRREKETENYNYDSAIEKSTWVKCATAQLWRDSHPCQWVRCRLELERLGSEGEACDLAILRLLYHHAGSDRRMALNLAEVTCACDLSNRERRLLGIYTQTLNEKHSCIKLAFGTDDELEDWIATLNLVAFGMRGLTDNAVHAGAAWGITERGHVFVHEDGEPKSPIDDMAMTDICWRHLGGGHFQTVESCPAGITWALGNNKTAWAYTGGYGGGVFKGLTGHNVRVGPMSDMKCVYIYENQRWNPISGFAPRGLLTDRYMWSDASGLVECTKDGTKLDSVHWHWVSDWQVDYHTPGGVDKDGWQYAADFPFSYHGAKGITDYVRRRRWFRLCRLSTTGPWVEVEPMPLRDVSLSLDARPDHVGDGGVALWAVSSTGEAVYRRGVTLDCPQGKAWMHVATEQQFESISVGARHRVWAIGQDGWAYARNGISDERPTGTAWFHIEPPSSNTVLTKVSAGYATVCAIDASGKLWRRAEVMDIFPEGTVWTLMSENVHSVSVGPDDQVWAIIDVIRNKRVLISRVLARRKGITEENPIGTEWETGYGMSWRHVSIRGSIRYQS
nr:tectonin beta-propeller repeat-containing protein 1-like [Dermacentor andersoni]